MTSNKKDCHLSRALLLWGSALVFILSLILYTICIDTGASLWDCPEYILGAYRMEVGHPPGNPTWQLMANVASHMALSQEYVAMAVNFTSALATALAAMLLYKIIFYLLRYSLFSSGRRSDQWLAGGGALAGALSFAWCDSVIFSAVEAEVYGLSIFFTALMIWLMLKWGEAYLSLRRDRARRFLILTAYVSGLAFGVHELNLLAFTSMALIYLFVRFKRRSVLRFWGAVATSFLLIAIALIVYFPGLISLTSGLELLMVNDVGLGYGSGVILSISLLILILCFLPFCGNNRKFITFAWSLLFFTIGCATYLIVPIRAAAAPPINTGNPSDPMAFMAYFKREQYGSKPLFYGPTPYSEPVKKTESDGSEDYVRFKTSPRYGKIEDGAEITDRFGFLTGSDSLSNAKVRNRGHGYIKTGYNYKLEFTPELNMYLPRFGRNPERMEEYKAWTSMEPSNMEVVMLQDSSVKRRPTYMQQFKFLAGYQLGYMYLRYLMWNFSGRQNNYPTTGEPEHGNFITGFPVIDNAMLGNQESLPDMLWKGNSGHNVYYMIPLLVGLLGAVFFGCGNLRMRRVSEVTLWLFLMTGIAIIFYLNQDLGEPRERDYAFLGSLMAFSIWIGLGISVVIRWIDLSIQKIETRKGSCRLRVLCVSLAVVAVPALILSQTYDDHYRRGRNTADSIGLNILNSLEPDAIIFVDGDNFTFPMWYAQEVLGARPDVHIVNTSYLVAPWYQRQLHLPGARSVKEIVDSNMNLMKPRPVYWHRALSDRVYQGLKGSTLLTLHTRKLMSDTTAEAKRKANLEGYLAMRKMVSGGKNGSSFISEPYVSNALASQRISALLLAKRMESQGDTVRAREVIERALKLWPVEVIKPVTLIVEGDTINERKIFADYAHQ